MVSQELDASGSFTAIGRLSQILLESVSVLAGVGEVEAACRLAGRACVTLKECDPANARRFDAQLHRLAAKLRW